MGILGEEAAAGVIGGAVVVVWFLLYDLCSGSNPFRIPALLEQMPGVLRSPGEKHDDQEQHVAPLYGIVSSGNVSNSRGVSPVGKRI